MVELKDTDYLGEVADKILQEAKNAGADQAEVIVNSGENIATRYGESHITQNTLRRTLTFTLRTQIGQQVGIYGGTMSSNGALTKMVNNAIDLVKFSPPDPEFPGFLDSQPTYRKNVKTVIESTPEDIADIISTIVNSALETDSKVSSVAGNVNYKANRSVFRNTHGVSGNYENSQFLGIITTAATVGDNESRAGCSLAGSTIEELDHEFYAKDVAERSVRGLNQGELEPGKYQSVLAHDAIVELMFHFGLASSSSMLINYQSPFKDKLGEKLFDEKFTITDATEDPTHISAQPFDAEGVPSPEITYIDEGVVKDFAYDLRNGKKLGVESNGRGFGGFAIFRAPAIKPGNRDLDKIISDIDDGVYVSSLWYANFVNMPEASLTGLTRDGLFRIKNGEIVGSLKNMRFTDTLFSMFKEIEPANDQKQKIHSTYGNLFGLGGKIPSIVLKEFNFSSQSKH